MKRKIEEKSSYEEKTQKNSSIDQATDSKQGKSDTRVIEKYNKTYFFNYIRFYKWGIDFNTWKMKQKIFSPIIKMRIKFINNYFSKRSACYHETLIDSVLNDEMDLVLNDETKILNDETEILKEQIKHLDKIIKVLEDIEARGSSLKDVRRERGWLVEYLTDTEIEIKKGNDYYGKARVQSQVDRNIEPR